MARPREPWCDVRRARGRDAVSGSRPAIAVTHRDEGEPGGGCGLWKLVATQTLEAFRHDVFVELTAPHSDHRRDEAAHHVVAKRLCTNRKSNDWRTSGTHHPLVLEPVPPRDEHSTKQRCLCGCVRRSSAKGTEVVRAQDALGGVVHCPKVQGSLDGPRPRVGGLESRRLRFQHQVAILAPRRREARMKRIVDGLGS